LNIPRKTKSARSGGQPTRCFYYYSSLTHDHHYVDVSLRSLNAASKKRYIMLLGAKWLVSSWISLTILVCSKQTRCVCGLSSSSPKKQRETTTVPFFTYKAMKRMEIPSILFSGVSNVACRLLRYQPQEIPPSQSSSARVAVVTGSNTGVGYETAKSLVLDHGYKVIIACRSSEKGIQACQSINACRNDKPNGLAVFVAPLDLANFDSVRSFGQAIHKNYSQIDVLVNNAGCNSAGIAPKPDGSLDLVFQTNFLGHFLLSNLLLSKCHRIVNLASVMHHFPVYSNKVSYGDVDSADFWRDKAIETSAIPEGTKRKTYAPSKLAAILFTSELQRRYGNSLQSIAVNPGAVYSDIWRNYSKLKQRLFRLLYLTPQQGCQTSVAASVLDFDTSDMLYLQPYRLPPRRNKSAPPFPMFEMLGPFMGYRETKTRLPHDGGVQASNSLFEVCEELTGCQFPDSL
jgi:NAD(P)-dependent dehydrogenase (short-subunit alcohol dehydrogenase family)